MSLGKFVSTERCHKQAMLLYCLKPDYLISVEI